MSEQAIQSSSPSPDQNLPPGEFLTLEELRRVLRLGRTAANELARTNALPIPAIKAGRQYRFSKRALQQLMARQQMDDPRGVAA